MLSGPPFQLTFWNTVDDVAFPDPAASSVLRTGVVCRNVMPSSRSCTFKLFALVCALAFCGRWLLGCLGIPDGEYGVEQSAAALFLHESGPGEQLRGSSIPWSISRAPRLSCCDCVLQLPGVSLCQYLGYGSRSRLGSCEILGKSQSKYLKVTYFCETLWLQPQQVFLFSGCFGTQGASLIGAAAAWTMRMRLPTF